MILKASAENGDLSSAVRSMSVSSSPLWLKSVPVTGPQQSYLSTLAQSAGEQVETTELTKAEASQKIDELKDKTGR